VLLFRPIRVGGTALRHNHKHLLSGCNQSVSSPCALQSDLSRRVVDNFFFASIFFREQYFVFAGMFRKNLFLHQLLEFIG
jgi:hypothetical protein